jgi:hypothetical protein
VLGPKAGSSSSRRWSAYHESTYMRMYNGGQISGWLKVRSRRTWGRVCAWGGGSCCTAGFHTATAPRTPLFVAWPATAVAHTSAAAVARPGARPRWWDALRGPC